MIGAIDVEATGDVAMRQGAIAERRVVGKGELLTASHLWTPEFYQHARAWLGNFQADEKPLAAALLNGFLYFSDRYATELMVSGFHVLSGSLAGGAASGADAKQAWETFFDTCLVSWVEGERAHGTDSGQEAARKFRKTLAFPEARIASPADALANLVMDRTKTIVFVDDFMGSGNQFMATWSRVFSYQAGAITTSFAEVVPQLADVRIFYCPSVSTACAIERLRRECPWVNVSAGAVLDARYDVMHPQSVIWSDEMRADGQAWVQAVSARLGLPDTEGAQDDWRGFNKLGLAMAIRDTIPDATMRIFRHNDGWAPLMKDA